PVAAPRPVEGADAEAIAGQDKALLPAIPQGDCELSMQMVEHALAVFLPQVREKLRVAMGLETMPLLFQGSFLLGVIEQFAVENDRDGAVLVPDRLPAIIEPDDAESPGRHREAGVLEITVLVRATVPDGVGHGNQNGFW